jgi:hypothetical protein
MSVPEELVRQLNTPSFKMVSVIQRARKLQAVSDLMIDSPPFDLLTNVFLTEGIKSLQHLPEPPIDPFSAARNKVRARRSKIIS